MAGLRNTRKQSLIESIGITEIPPAQQTPRLTLGCQQTSMTQITPNELPRKPTLVVERSIQIEHYGTDSLQIDISKSQFFHKRLSAKSCKITTNSQNTQ